MLGVRIRTGKHHLRQRRCDRFYSDIVIRRSLWLTWLLPCRSTVFAGARQPRKLNALAVGGRRGLQGRGLHVLFRYFGFWIVDATQRDPPRQKAPVKRATKARARAGSADAARFRFHTRFPIEGRRRGCYAAKCGLLSSAIGRSVPRPPGITCKRSVAIHLRGDISPSSRTSVGTTARALGQ